MLLASTPKVNLRRKIDRKPSGKANAGARIARGYEAKSPMAAFQPREGLAKYGGMRVMYMPGLAKLKALNALGWLAGNPRIFLAGPFPLVRSPSCCRIYSRVAIPKVNIALLRLKAP